MLLVFNFLKLNSLIVFSSISGSIEVTVSNVLENAQSSTPKPAANTSIDLPLKILDLNKATDSEVHCSNARLEIKQLFKAKLGSLSLKAFFNSMVVNAILAKKP
jgi:hypothetical protein